jgi:hypothetical protein
MLIGLAAIAIHGVAPAQAPAGPQRAEGVVSALSDTSLTLTKADGTTAMIPLLAGRTITVTAPIAVDQIQPGSYVATANKSQPDGTGVSIELRVYPPDSPRFDVNRAMDEGGQTMMTNGRVATAVSSNGGRLLTVDYGSGSRQITVPANLAVVSNTPGSPALVKVGLKLVVTTFPAVGDRPARQAITIAKADLPAS